MTLYQINNEQATTPTRQNVASGYTTQVNIANPASGTLRRAKILEMFMGQAGPPNATDCNVEWDVMRTTAAGTAVASTPNPIDPADPVSVMVGAINATVEPTTPANSMLHDFALNQRASQRWVAYSDIARLVVPATASNGISIRVKSATYAGQAQAAFVFDE